MKLGEALLDGAVAGILPWAIEEGTARDFGLAVRDVEAAALKAGLRLERYARNFRTIDQAGQLALHESRVVVVGCGGLGGHVVEMLARLGVGTLVVVDSDSFEPSNLNRQLFCTLASLGRPKVEVAAERIASVNPATRVLPHQARFNAETSGELLEGAQVAVDALDGIPSRLALAEACGALGIPLVHAGIAGWYVQASTVAPGSGSLSALYADATGDRGIEAELGNPAFTPAVAAGIEVAEVVKLIIGKKSPLEGALLHLDLDRMESVRFPLG